MRAPVGHHPTTDRGPPRPLGGDLRHTTVFEAYANFAQQLPASEAHHHVSPSGHAGPREVTREALKLRRGQLLPPGAATEELAARQDLWTTYATATSTLLHGIGKPVTDQRVRL